MSWLLQLYRTYPYIVEKDRNNQLWPIAHFSKLSDIELTIDLEGNLIDALCVFLDSKQATIIPVTEHSVARSGSKKAPHPLCEELSYLSSDKPNADNVKHSLYLSTLGRWVNSEFSHDKAKAVYSYVKKGTIWKDLNRLFTLPTKDVHKLFIRWRVISEGDVYTGTWEDLSLINAWINFEQENSLESYAIYQQDTMKNGKVVSTIYQDANKKLGTCSISGLQNTRLARQFPKFIRNAGDSTRLISQNDWNGFTFRGRLTDKEPPRYSKISSKQVDFYEQEEESQVANVSFEVLHKAMNSLRWLIKTQAETKGGLTTVAWATPKVNATANIEAPQPTVDVASWLDDDDLSWQPDMPIEKVNKLVLSNDLGRQMSEKLRLKLKGYQQHLSDTEQLSIITLDAATPGRMAATYYFQSLPSEYLANLATWFEQFSWYQRYSQDIDVGKKKPLSLTTFPIKPPSPYQIAQAAYGKTLSDEMKRQTYSRVLPCIVEGGNRAFPEYLVELCFQRACNPVASERWEWERNVGVACALYRGYRARHPKPDQRRNFNVALDKTYHSRDYLYGRLLAVAENIESLALYRAGENRATNAERYMQRFADKPFSTWRNIELSLDSYKKRLRNSRGSFLNKREKDLEEIMASFDIEQFKDDSKLSGEFLLGYHCQKMVYRDNESDKSSNTENLSGE